MPFNDYTCNFCNEEFLQVKAGSFANHKRWCKKNPRFEEILQSTVQKLNEQGDKRRAQKASDRIDKTSECEKCAGIFTRLLLPNEHARFCSIACANSKTHSQETKAKISNTLKVGGKVFRPQKQPITCKVCSKETIPTELNLKRNKLCSEECYAKLKEQRKKERQKNLTEKQIYKHACSFNFSVYKFPDEFELNLIEKHGWYKPRNRGDNLTGITRDHMLSRTFGFENNIPIEHIKHPANCQLLVHGDNISKGKKSSISYQELLQRIDRWDKKYKLLMG